MKRIIESVKFPCLLHIIFSQCNKLWDDQIIIKKLIEHKIRTKEGHYSIQIFNDEMNPALGRFTNHLAWADTFPLPTCTSSSLLTVFDFLTLISTIPFPSNRC